MEVYPPCIPAGSPFTNHVLKKKQVKLPFNSNLSWSFKSPFLMASPPMFHHVIKIRHLHKITRKKANKKKDTAVRLAGRPS